jgi:hypothetical protein
MAIEYKWTITQTDFLTADGDITTAHWTATAVDGEYTASIYSTCSWPEGSPIIPYADVTQADVLKWCWDSGVDKDATEKSLAQNIAMQKNPPVSQGLPWAKPTVTTEAVKADGSAE